MGPDSLFPADLVTFTEEILNGKLHFLCVGFKAEAFGICDMSIYYILSWSYQSCSQSLQRTKSGSQFCIDLSIRRSSFLKFFTSIFPKILKILKGIEILFMRRFHVKLSD